MMLKRILLVLAVSAVAAGCGDDGSSSADAASPSDARVNDANGRTIVEMVTSMGTMAIELFPQHMPITTANFLTYVDSNWYNDTLIHRVQDDWVIQGGGWTTGLANKSPNAPIVLETSPMVGHVHGAISMARTSDPNSATSQWFICDWPDGGGSTHEGQLNGNYAAFGIVIEGLDVLAAITQVPIHAEANTMGNPPTLERVPVTEIFITSVTRR